MKLICNAADRCGVTSCPHATGHRPLAILILLCNEEAMPCKILMEEDDIGEVKAECQCVPVEEKEQ